MNPEWSELFATLVWIFALFGILAVTGIIIGNVAVQAIREWRK